MLVWQPGCPANTFYCWERYINVDKITIETINMCLNNDCHAQVLLKDGIYKYKCNLIGTICLISLILNSHLSWCNSCVFLYELSGCGLEFGCSHLLQLSGLRKEFLEIQVNYRVWIHSETRVRDIIRTYSIESMV